MKNEDGSSYPIELIQLKDVEKNNALNATMPPCMRGTIFAKVLTIPEGTRFEL